MRWIENPMYRALILRKNNDDLSDWLDRASIMYRRYGAEIIGRPATIRWPSGAIFRTGHLKDHKSYEKYLGHEYQKILIEELTEIPQEKFYLQILGSCRSTVDGLKPQMFCTTNPGNIGHAWVKKRFVDHTPWGKPWVAETKRKRIFIQSTVEDNPTLIEKDPGYVDYLESFKKTDPDMYKAWRLGDWSVFAGQMFREFAHQTHVSDQFGWSLDATENIIGFDWGYNDPASVHWLARSPEDARGIRRVWIYRELYDNEKPPRWWAKAIARHAKREKLKYIVLPHDCFARPHGVKAIADIFREEIPDLPIKKAESRQGSRARRVAITHEFLSDAPDGKPHLMIHPSCKNLIRTLPTLVYSETNPEVPDDRSDDHCWDSLSYALASYSKAGGKSGGVGGSKLKLTEKLAPTIKHGRVIPEVDLLAETKKYHRKKRRLTR